MESHHDQSFQPRKSFVPLYLYYQVGMLELGWMTCRETDFLVNNRLP